MPMNKKSLCTCAIKINRRNAHSSTRNVLQIVYPGDLRTSLHNCKSHYIPTNLTCILEWHMVRFLISDLFSTLSVSLLFLTVEFVFTNVYNNTHFLSTANTAVLIVSGLNDTSRALPFLLIISLRRSIVWLQLYTQRMCMLSVYQRLIGNVILTSTITNSCHREQTIHTQVGSDTQVQSNLYWSCCCKAGKLQLHCEMQLLAKFRLLDSELVFLSDRM